MTIDAWQFSSLDPVREWKVVQFPPPTPTPQDLDGPVGGKQQTFNILVVVMVVILL